MRARMRNELLLILWLFFCIFSCFIFSNVLINVYLLINNYAMYIWVWTWFVAVIVWKRVLGLKELIELKFKDFSESDKYWIKFSTFRKAQFVLLQSSNSREWNAQNPCQLNICHFIQYLNASSWKNLALNASILSFLIEAISNMESTCAKFIWSKSG